MIRILLRIKNFQLKNSLIICSDPRSGSTWLLQLFNQLPKTICNFEPLHVNKGVVPKKNNLGWHPSLPKDYSDFKIDKLFREILTIRKFNKWTTGFVSLKKIYSSNVVVTKFILANHLLPWIIQNYEGQLINRPIYLIRHPIATCLSQLRTFQKVDDKDLFSQLKKENVFEIPKGNFNERFKIHQEYLNKLNTRFERQIALWCINNAHLVNEMHSCKIETVFYEKLVLNPKDEFMRILDSLDIKVSKELIENINYKEPSKTNFLGSYKKNSQKQIHSYLDLFTESELNKIQDILNYFNLKVYRAYSAYPVISGSRIS